MSRQDALQWRIAGHGDGRLGDALSDASTGFAFPETPCGEVADMMVESGIGRVPVVDPRDRRVVGIISRQDLLKVRERHKEIEKVRTRGSE